MKLSEYYTKNVRKNLGVIWVTPHIECKDGFIVSVQASFFHRCLPQADLPNGEYTHWEIMMVSLDFDLIQYVDPDCWVGCYVPTEVLERVINRHNTLLLTYKAD